MVTLKLLLCADAVIRDAETNNISVFTIIQEIQAEGFPLFIPRFAVLAVVERSKDDDQDITFDLEANLGTMNLINEPVTVNFLDKQRNNTIINIGGLPLTKPGILSIVLKHQETEFGSYQISITP